MTDLLGSLAVFDGLDDFDDTLTPFVPASSSVVVPTNTWVEDTEVLSFGGVDVTVPTRFRLNSPILSSIQHRLTNATRFDSNGVPQVYEDRQDFYATFVTGLDVQVAMNDGDWTDISDVALTIIRQASPNLTVSDQQLLALLKGYGWDRTGTWPLYVQHLGADPDKYAEAVTAFRQMGATDRTGSIRASGELSRVQSFWRAPANAPAITSLEISKVDRSFSANKQTGFVGFAEAALGTLKYILSLHKERSLLIRDLTADPTDETAAARLGEIKSLFVQPMTLRAFRNWSGTNTGQSVSDALVGRQGWYPQQVSCGRFTVVNNGGSEVQFDVWRTANASTSVATQTVQSSTVELDETEQY